MVRAKQGHLDGMAPTTIAEIEDAADAFVEARGKWQRAHAPMMEARAVLESAMKKHKLKTYEYDGRIFELAATEKVKVKVAKDEAEDEDADD